MRRLLRAMANGAGGVAVISAVLGCSLALAEIADCEAPIVVERGSRIGRVDADSVNKVVVSPRMIITSRGSFCLKDNVVQRLLYRTNSRLLARSNHGDQIVSMSADDIKLDLNGRSIENHWYPDGFPLIKFYREEDVQFPDGAGFVRTTVRNGVMLSDGESGVGIDFRSFEYQIGDGGVAIKIPVGETPKSYFRDTSHLIELLTLNAGLAGILIEGKNNTIRNNRIVVSGDRAIVATGPNLVLEGNVIEVRGSLTDHAKVYGHSLPVQLIQADGAIVRNNRIRFIGSASDHRPEAAFDVIESRDVLFENNTIEAIPALERHDAASSLR